MKVALCLEFPIEQHGGTEVLVRELIRGLASKHTVVLVSNDDDASLQPSSVREFVSEHIPWPGAPATRMESLELARQLAQKNLDVAHFHFGGTFGWGSRMPNFSPVIHLSRSGVPCVATNHGVFGIFDGYIGAQRSLLTKAALLPVAWAIRMHLVASVRAEVAVSQHDYRALQRRFWPVRNKFRQIYHSRLHEPPPPPQLERTKDIICVGTIGPRKGQTFLTEAFCEIAERHTDWKLVLIGRQGEPAMMERIQSLRREHALEERILLLGQQSDAEVNHWLRTAAIFAMPSVAEGLGLSLQEALFNGCACVTARAGGTQDLIQNEDNGLSVEPANASALAGALERLICDDALRQRFASRGPASILEKEMTAEKMVEKYEDLYEEILK